MLQLSLWSPMAASDLVDSTGEDPKPTASLLLLELADELSAAVVCCSLPEKLVTESENVVALLFVVPDSSSESMSSKTIFTSASFI